MKRRRRTRNRRRIQLTVTAVPFLILSAVLIQFSADKIGAQSDISKITYKYYTSHYVERVESLWSIAQEYMTDEYRSVEAYISEIQDINGLHGTKLQQGSHICVPYYSLKHN